MATFSCEAIKSVGEILNDKKRPLTERFRALFTLKNIGGSQAISSISHCFDDSSALLKHELAYCLGQMQDEAAIPTLIEVLKDERQDAMVRHEAGEALGAIGSAQVVDLLKQYATDPVPEVAETCQLALNRINWLNSDQSTDKIECSYSSVDPAPPCSESSVAVLREMLLDETADLFTRYRAMFSLRNRGGDESVKALAEGLTCGSALFRHEIAYVLGQMQHPAATHQLSKSLADPQESAMVRHECAEALGAIATDESMAVLKQFCNDPELVVKQSCIVALDMSEYENSNQFEYADSLQRVTNLV